MFLISLVHYHHPALLHYQALILNHLLTYLMVFLLTSQKYPFLKVFSSIAINLWLRLVS